MNPRYPIVLLVPFGSYWLATYGRVKFLIQTPEMKMLGNITEPYERYFKINRGDVILDVGASIGEQTIPFAKKVKEGMVVAVEPNPQKASYLRRNVATNGLQNVQIIQKVAWKDKRMLSWKLSPGKSVKVQADTLDNIVFESGADRVDFLKIDVEGAEVEVLEGARGVLSVTKKVAIETHLRQGGCTSARVCQLLKTHGFKVYVAPRFCLCHPKCPSGLTVRLER